MIDQGRSFGELRAATERAFEDPTCVDEVVWCILRAGEGEHEKMYEYATQKLRSASVGRVALSDVIQFVVEGEPWLLEHLLATQDEHIGQDELPRRLLVEDHVHAWCAGFAWLIARRRGHIEWPGPTVRHWLAVVDPAEGYWFGMGLNEGNELRLYQGKEEKAQVETKPYIIRHCQLPDGDPWMPETLPGWPETLNGAPTDLDDEWETYEDEDYDA